MTCHCTSILWVAQHIRHKLTTPKMLCKVPSRAAETGGEKEIWTFEITTYWQQVKDCRLNFSLPEAFPAFYVIIIMAWLRWSIQKAKLGPFLHFFLKWKKRLRNTVKFKRTGREAWLGTWRKGRIWGACCSSNVCEGQKQRETCWLLPGDMSLPTGLQSCIFTAIPVSSGRRAIHSS